MRCADAAHPWHTRATGASGDAFDATCVLEVGDVAGQRIAARLQATSIALAVLVAVGSVVAGVCTVGFAARKLPDLFGIAALTLWIVAVVVSAVAVLLIERHRRVMVDQMERLHERNRGLQATAVRKDEFLASVSHELRTPLNVVLGYIDLLLEHSFGSLEPAQRDILHRIMKNASNLSHLINDLVDLSRIEAGRMRIEMEDVELAPLVADLTSVTEVLLAGHDVAFRADVALGCDRLRADPDRLKQIVSNLLVNAVKFTERGTIVLTAESRPQGRVAISVTDTGIGIPAADQQAIFEPFRQVHDRQRRAPGAGIGLSIASRLAALMGGRLEVQSAPGRGSRFTLTLDAAPATAADGSDTAPTTGEPELPVSGDATPASETPPRRARG